MGVHLTITVDHDITHRSLDAIRNHFAPLQPMFLEIAEKYKLEADKWRDTTEPGRSRPENFLVPARFSVGIGDNALRFHSAFRFSEFIDDSDVRDIMRRFSHLLARTLGQRRALYAPCEGIGDTICEWVTDGLALADMEARLLKLGAPPKTIDELASRSLPELRYFIDDFVVPPR